MQLIVGLGNPGKEYSHTRHNAGFMAIDALAHASGMPGWEKHNKLQAELVKRDQLLLLKPQTYMNRSGEVVRAAWDYFVKEKLSAQIELPSLYVLHDDLDLEFGHWKLQFGTGPQGHNGLLSLYQHLGTRLFWHVRIGVDGRQGDRSIPPDSYVLSPFAAIQAEPLKQMLAEVVTEVRARLVVSNRQ